MPNIISVIVPIYNVDNCLRKCIESILHQTYKDLQILLVDDGSSDQSAAICDEYALKDDRVEVIHQENAGPTAARKAGLVLAKGEYIGFVDADDYIDPDFYQILLDDIVKYDVDFVHSGLIMEDNASETVMNQYESGAYVLEGMRVEFIKAYILEIGSNVHMQHTLFSKLFKADLIKPCFLAVPDFLSRGEDLLGVCYCILNSKRIFLDRRAGYHYVMRSDSITHNSHMETVIEFGTLYKCIIDVFKEYGLFEDVREDLAAYFKNEYIMLLSQLSKRVLIYEFPDIEIVKEKSIVLYGAGMVGQNYYAQLCKYSDIDIIAWADRNYKEFHFDYKEIISKESITDQDFDLLVIAVMNESVAESIKQELICMGIPENKIIWRKPSQILDV